jgi:hypothetical protein
MKRILIIIGFITTSLNFFGCSGLTNKKDEKFDSQTVDIIFDTLGVHRNKPFFKVLNEQIIDTTSDDDILKVVFDDLLARLPNDHEKDYETVMSWNKSRQAIFMIMLFEAEVSNGGYNQFYYNSSGEFYKQLPSALKLVGANKLSNLTQRANEVYYKEKSNIRERQDGTIEGFFDSYEDNPLNKFDDEFFKLYEKENLQSIQIAYVRAHKTDFIQNQE